MTEESISLGYTIFIWLLISVIILSISLSINEALQEEYQREALRKVLKIMFEYLRIAESYEGKIKVTLPKLVYDYKVVASDNSIIALVEDKVMCKIEIDPYSFAEEYTLIPGHQYEVVIMEEKIVVIEEA
ncbi:MAG: hypothetical protein DRJ66_03335 [Thermoprotei archaeon]|nr:MAG: hypothetical protein DRJ66_03335 [Thermoprotei archaeon]RLF19818.1 MAG: hypothetical protein DRZ82_04290 [Thermoprotei archaeon]